MKKRLFFLLPLLFLLAGGFCTYWIYAMPMNDENDVLAFNRIAKETAKNWDNLDLAAYEELTYPFCVLTRDGEILHTSSPDISTSLTEALTLGYPILDVEQEGHIIGKIIIIKSPQTILMHYRSFTLFFIWFFSLLLFVFCFAYFYYLCIKIIRPFQELKQFAAEVSKGNLNFSLKRRKNNLFGAFTESFDMMREQLLLAREREYQANKNKKEMVASLSHDIKTPVTSIKLTSELLLELEKEPHLKTKIQMIYNKTEQIEELITNLFQTTLQELEHLIVTPIETYSSHLKSMIQDADYKGTAAISSIPDCMLFVDELRLSQIFSNVISNSYKYADTDILITASLSDTHMILSIKDKGNSLLEDEIPLLFNKFYRGSNSADHNGSGLGLYICKRLIEQMQGDMYCTCSKNGFTVVLLLKLA